MQTPGTRLPWVTRIMLLFAAAWSVLILVAGALVPVSMSSSAESSSDGTVVMTTTASTLIESEGRGVVLLLTIPLLLTLAVTVALTQRRRHGAAAAAWTLTGVLGLFTLLALMSIGVAIVPVVAALVAACLTALPRRAPAAGTQPAATSH